MATEGVAPVRQAILLDLVADATLTAMVPVAQIQPVGVPLWPFIRWGTPSAIPINVTCVDGDEISVAIHSFAKPRKNGSGQVVETAEDHADRIGTQVLRRLGRRQLELASGNKIKVHRIGYQLLPDGAEADAWHHVASFRVRVIS